MLTAIRRAASRHLGGALMLLALVLRGRLAEAQRLLRVNALFSEGRIVGNFSAMDRLFFHAPLPVTPPPEGPAPLPEAPAPLPDRFTHDGREITLQQWKDARAITAMVVLKNGRIVHEDYRLGTRPDDRRISWSVAKSMLSAALGILLERHPGVSLDDQVVDHVPALKGSAYDGASLRNVLNMASGVAFNEDYLDWHSDINRMGRVLATGGSMDGFAAGLAARDWAPGRYRRYVSIDTHVVGMVMRALSGETARELLGRELFSPLGLERAPYYLTDGEGTDFVLGGLNLTTRDYARFGLMIAQGGRIAGRQVVPEAWVAESTAQSAPAAAPTEPAPIAALGYGYQWWLPPEAEEGEVFAIGIYGQYVYIDRARKTVIAVNAADRLFRDGDGAVTLQNIDLFRTIARG